MQDPRTRISRQKGASQPCMQPSAVRVCGSHGVNGRRELVSYQQQQQRLHPEWQTVCMTAAAAAAAAVVEASLQ